MYYSNNWVFDSVNKVWKTNLQTFSTGVIMIG